MIFWGGDYFRWRHDISAVLSSKKLMGKTVCVHHVDLLSTIKKNIDAGDHILQCDGIPGPVSTAKQPATDVDIEKCEAKWKMTSA